MRKLFRNYAAAKRRQNVLDYDDLLLYWAKMMKDPNIAVEIRSRFDHVLVDEYQDTNHLQAKILFQLKPEGRGLTVVGDDAQAIYSFRAATVRNILDFPDQCVPKARVIPLEQNYRSIQPILVACNKVMGFAQERYTKNLFSKRQSEQKPFLTTVADTKTQARYVAQQILDAREAGVPLKSQATLFRASSHSAELELELAKRQIPFVKYGGLKFLDAAHIKDVVCALRWCENSRDRVAGFRVLQLLPGIGPGTAAKILAKVEGRRHLWKVLARQEVPKAAARDWRRFGRLIRRMHQGKNSWPTEIRLIREWYEPLLYHIHDDAQFRAPDLAQLEKIASGYDCREHFLTELALDPPDRTRGPSTDTVKDEDYTILSTIHSAKGLEWRVVRMLNVVDGCIPLDHADDIEEERRLLHVGMTRAKNELDLIVPQRFFRYQQAKFDDRHTFGVASNFIPTSIRGAFDCRHWREQTALPDKRGRRPDRSANILASVGQH